MKLVSWNVNGIRACVKKGFLDFFMEENADIFCIQESKLQEGQIELDLDGYHQYWNYAEKKGYSGTAVFTKEKPLHVSYGIAGRETEPEGRSLTLEFENFYLLNVYTPNSKRDLARLPYRLEWEDEIRGYILELEQKKPVILCGDLKEAQPSYKSKPIIVCGDFNVAATALDIKNPKSNEHNAGFTIQEREKFQQLLDAGFTDSFRALHPDEEKYSWWSYRFKAREKNVGWRLDYFLVSNDAKGKIVEADILTDVMGSDHCPISLEIDI
ncbi:exodeoxyribonuclease III [Bacillus infantis]|uniref:exodeoxyribonuclease III n=1 Tax=Bacillus infantis TaxID=324767 RepID=UPI003CE8CB45